MGKMLNEAVKRHTYYHSRTVELLGTALFETRFVSERVNSIIERYMEINKDAKRRLVAQFGESAISTLAASLSPTWDRTSRAVVAMSDFKEAVEALLANLPAAANKSEIRKLTMAIPDLPTTDLLCLIELVEQFSISQNQKDDN